MWIPADNGHSRKVEAAANEKVDFFNGVGSSYSTGGTLGTKFRVDKPILFNGASVWIDSNGYTQDLKMFLWRVSDRALLSNATKTVNHSFTNGELKFSMPEVKLVPNVEYMLGFHDAHRLAVAYPKNDVSQVLTPSGVSFTIETGYKNFGSNGLPGFPSTKDPGSKTNLSVYFYPNQYPNINITSPTNNQTLVEGNTYVIAGTATEADAGNVVTVKYKIDNGSTYNITAAVSDGTTPINFSKSLTYLNNRLYDGQTPVTPILDDQVTHTLKVWAEDDQGGKSAEVTRNFTVLYNQPPQISGSDQDLGAITEAPSIQYSVTDIEGYSFTITEAVNGQTIRTFPGVDEQQETLEIPDDMWIRLQPGVTHSLTITATDQYGATATRTYTFARVVDGIELITTQILPADEQPSRVILSLNGTIPTNANLSVLVCNNALDAEPTWEDMTDSVKNKRPYVFTNTTSTSGQWGILFKISILPGA